MRTVKVKCVGLTPFMMDMMSDAVLDGLDTGVRPQEQKDRPPHQKAEEKVYHDKEGKIAIPAEMLESCLVNAGRNVKNGKKQISTATDTTLYDLGVAVQEQYLILTDRTGKSLTDESWVVDRRRGIGAQAKTPTAVCITRPKFEEWAFEFTLTYDERKVGRDTMVKLVETAGSAKGLGSFRPGKRGRFGRFKPVRWDDKALQQVDDNKLIIIVDGVEKDAA